MTEKEVQEVLDELNTVRPEKLNENAKRLFEAVMQIADKRDDLQQRVDKAVEYVNNNSLYEQESDYDNEDNLILGMPSDEKATNDLLNILKGNDK